jgi:GxxExxY protein
MLKNQELTDAVLGAFYDVYNTLGYGFLEKVYENALSIELRKLGLAAVQQVPINVYYNGAIVGEYFADILVDGKVIIEVKSTQALAPEHEAQLLNYLRGTDLEVGLLLNFGPKPQFRRKVYDNTRKPARPRTHT